MKIFGIFFNNFITKNKSNFIVTTTSLINKDILSAEPRIRLENESSNYYSVLK